MRNLPIRTRLFIILALLILPIAVLTFVLGSALNKDIEFAQQEVTGVAYERPLLTLLDEVADYQIAAIRKDLGDSSAASDLAEGNRTIDATFEELSKLDGQIGADLKFNAAELKLYGRPDVTVAALKQEWLRIKENSSEQQAYSGLLDHLDIAIAHLGDTSNMILDPDLDSFYLVDISLNAMPKTLHNLAEIKSSVYLLLQKNQNQLPASNYLDVSLDVYKIEQVLLPRTKDGITAAIENNQNSPHVSPTIRRNLEPASVSYEKAANNLVAAMRNLTGGQTMSGNKFIDVADVLHDGSAEMGQTVLNELQLLLEARIDRLQQKRLLLLGGCGVLVLIALVVSYFISNGITTPIKNMTDAMQRLAGGNKTVEIPATENRDEIGEMAKAVEVFKSNMIETDRLREEQERQKLQAEQEKRAAMQELANNFERDVKGIVNTVASAATELSQTASTMTDMVSKSATLASGATSAAGQTMANVRSVASAAEELSASVREISNQLQRTNQMVQESTEKTENADRLAVALGSATTRVAEVMGIISNIAGQINLLALNATIESARAGGAGKGFAVVANEVKSLASQTDKSITEIQAVVQEMRGASDAITAALTDIRSSVNNISGAATAVASAVEEQSATTNEIAKSMQLAAQDTQLISSNLTDVSGASTEAGSVATQVLGASRDVSKQAENLSTQVDTFLSNIRAA